MPILQILVLGWICHVRLQKICCFTISQSFKAYKPTNQLNTDSCSSWLEISHCDCEWIRTVPLMLSLWFQMPTSGKKDNLTLTLIQRSFFFFFCKIEIYTLNHSRNTCEFCLKVDFSFNSFKSQTICHLTTPNAVIYLNRLTVFYQQHMVNIKTTTK